MKTSFKIQILKLLLLSIALSFTYCKDTKNETFPKEDNTATDALVEEDNNDESTAAVPEKILKADLLLSNVRLRKIDHPTGFFTHLLSVDITNSGQAVARGFDCVANYSCPAGTYLTAGDNIVQGGYLSPNQKRNYSQPIRIRCVPIPGVIDFKLDADVNNDVDEINENNNVLKVKLNVPF